ncbi:MAG: hypothetical protein ABS92_00140 [Thiobacillus sp. SCN 63-374]|nr:MAG: hypothetical protein ABS92_00140 [Thiobacillus sp. SCN 63-374]
MVSAPFLFARWPKAHDPQGVFAHHMYDRQHCQHIKYVSERLRPLFAASHTSDIETVRTLEHHHRVGEVQPVLVEVGFLLRLVSENVRAH